MLIFCDPHAPATADITAFHPARSVERYDGTAGDIFTQVNTGTPGRTVIAQPPHHHPGPPGRRAGVSVMTLPGSPVHRARGPAASSGSRA